MAQMESERGPLAVLVVEDDAPLRELLAKHLAAEGWAVRAVGDGEAALAECEARRPDVVALDLSLPGRSGLEVCTELRLRFHPSPGVIMVTARASELDVVLGFEHGADDYVVKPCRPRELVARVKALARRIFGDDGTRPPEAIAVGALRIEPAARRAAAGSRPLKLTATEFALLAELMRAPDRVHTRGDLLRRVFDSTHEGYARNVDCHVARLRRKLEAAGLAPAPIETVHGVGYTLRSA